MKTLAWIAVIILVIIGCFAAAYYFIGNSSNNESVIIYTNTDYGFTFSLPNSWQGYTIVESAWQGNALGSTTTLSNTAASIAPTGPKIIIRNPKWTATAPYEDIPILVFTIAEWNAYTADDFSISAAPIKATELARNNTYVFALPPRWDFDYSLGYEEAESIIAGNPLSATFIVVSDTATSDFKNSEYLIEGQRVMLKNGIAETETTQGSATKVITRYFGNELVADLDGDGRKDVAFIITQERGGSGVFFYAVAARNTGHGYAGSDGYYLGDRIAPQSTNISQNPHQKYVVVFNYADRVAGESMTTKPSQGKSVYLKLDPIRMQWGIVQSDFEGESR